MTEASDLDSEQEPVITIRREEQEPKAKPPGRRTNKTYSSAQDSRHGPKTCRRSRRGRRFASSLP